MKGEVKKQDLLNHRTHSISTSIAVDRTSELWARSRESLEPYFLLFLELVSTDRVPWSISSWRQQQQQQQQQQSQQYPPKAATHAPAVILVLY